MDQKVAEMQKTIDELTERIVWLEGVVRGTMKDDDTYLAKKDNIAIRDKGTADEEVRHKTNKGLSYREILLQEHKNLVDNLDPSGELLDHLVMNGALEVSDSEQIGKIPRRKYKIRYLLTRLHRYSPDHFEKFTIALHKTNPDLARHLNNLCMDQENRRGDYHEVKCTECLMRKRVDIGDIIDVLVQQSVIGIEQLEKHSTGEIADNKLWNYIFFIINTWQSEENPLHILITALGEAKYDDIVHKLEILSKTERHIMCLKTIENKRLRTTEYSKYKNEDSSTDTYSSDIDQDSGSFRRVQSFINPTQDKYRPKYSQWEDPPENIELKIQRAKTFNISYFSQRRKKSRNPVRRVKRGKNALKKESDMDTEGKVSDSTDTVRPHSSERFV